MKAGRLELDRGESEGGGETFGARGKGESSSLPLIENLKMYIALHSVPPVGQREASVI